MAAPPSIDASAGAGANTHLGNANFVVIDTPTPMPPELLTQNIPTQYVPAQAPAAPVSSISDKPVHTWTLRPRRWALGLVGPLREAAYVDEKGKDALKINFSGGSFFSDAKAVVTDVRNNDAQPFSLIDASSIFTGDKITLQAQSVTQNQDIGKIEKVGCDCQGVRKITIGGDVYYMKVYIGFLNSIKARMKYITIFASNNTQPLIHWNENTCKVTIFTELDVTLMLLIMAHMSLYKYIVAGHWVMADTLPEVDALTHFLQHPRFPTNDQCQLGNHSRISFHIPPAPIVIPSSLFS